MERQDSLKEQVTFDVGAFRRLNPEIGLPHSASTNGMLTDWYQITMTYAYWKAGMHNKRAVFDLYFRKCPFKGAFTVLAGTSEAVRFVNSFSFRSYDVDYIRSQLPHADPAFFEYIAGMDARDVQLYGIPDGTIVFPNYPCLRVEGPLAVVQLLETPLLNIMNFASLVATQAARMKIALGLDSPAQILEFGCRRAQGPDGAMSASRYSYLGGADGTSNVRAGQLFDIPVTGTHAHAFITSFSSLHDLHSRTLLDQPGDFVDDVLKVRAEWSKSLPSMQNEGELAAFISYAQSFPDGFLALIDTYDTIRSGARNFICVAIALFRRGFSARGIRLDSGDLAYLSKEVRELFRSAEKEFGLPGGFHKNTLKIVASNDINEQVLLSLEEEGHEIDVFGIGTNLVTCQAQPALGMVFKLAELEGVPCMKLSQEISKTSTPARKDVYRLFNSEGQPILDLVQAADEETYSYLDQLESDSDDVAVYGHSLPSSPKLASSPFQLAPKFLNLGEGLSPHGTHRMSDIPSRTPTKPPRGEERLYCRSLTDEHKRCFVRPSTVKKLLVLVFDRGVVPADLDSPTSLKEARSRVLQQLNSLRADHLRHLNPTPYKVACTQDFFNFFHGMWQKTAPIPELN